MSQNLVMISRAEFRWARRGRWLILFFLIFAAKLWTIRQYGGSVPVLDQWSGEAWKMYKPFLEGTLSLPDLVAGHNEHRIFFSRLLFLLLLKVNGLWEPLLEMMMQAAIHAAVLAFFIFLCVRPLRPRHRFVFILATSPLWFLPFGWENTLSGFQSQFYFVSLFGILTLWLTWRHESLSAGWWGGLAAAVAGCFSMAGGILAAAAAATLMAARIWTNPARWKRHLTGSVLLVVVALGGFLAIPQVPEHDVFRARSFLELAGAFLSVLSWPFAGQWGFLILQAPFVIVGLSLIRKRSKAADPAWLMMAFGAWGWLQALATAYARAHITLLAPRYLDALCLTLGASLACLCLWVTRLSSAKQRPWAACLVGGWILALTAGSLHHFVRHTSVEISHWKEMAQAQEDTVKDYLLTHEPQLLAKKPIPFPDAGQLRAWLDDPVIAGILPARIRPPLHSSRRISEDSFATRSYFENGGKAPPDGLRYWSSYTAQGDLQRGQIELKFPGARQSRMLETFVSGQPGSDGMTLVLTDRNGQTHNLAPLFSPGLEWKRVLVRIPPGAFTLLAKDDRNDAWLALSNPREVGVLSAWMQRFSDICLEYGLPLLAGCAAGLLTLALFGIPERLGRHRFFRFLVLLLGGLSSGMLLFRSAESRRGTPSST